MKPTGRFGRRDGVAKPLPCLHQGSPVPPPSGRPTAKAWHKCDHPDRPLKGLEIVCPCVGCGTRCSGYTPDDPNDIGPVTPPPDPEPSRVEERPPERPEEIPPTEAENRTPGVEGGMVVPGEGGGDGRSPDGGGADTGGKSPVPPGDVPGEDGRGVLGDGILPPAEPRADIHDVVGVPPSRPGGTGEPLEWAYGVTTVPKRRDSTLPVTLASLKKAGFDRPRLFVDGGYDSCSWEEEFGLDVTLRGGEPVRTFGNWVASLWELYCRFPQADRYAMFQDDFVTYAGLREYLDSCRYPGEPAEKPEPRPDPRPTRRGKPIPAPKPSKPRIHQLPGRGYWNLYTFPSNDEHRVKAIQDRSLPADHRGWYRSNQLGRGAVALVFNREAVIALLGSAHMADRPVHSDRGWRAVDGGIVTAMEKAGWSEYVHSPSLVQHIGDESSMGSRPQPKAKTFKGEGFDARSLNSTASL